MKETFNRARAWSLTERLSEVRHFYLMTNINNSKVTTTYVVGYSFIYLAYMVRIFLKRRKGKFLQRHCILKRENIYYVKKRHLSYYAPTITR